MKKICLFGLVVFITACQQHKPIESLTFEEKAAITKQCQANGKLETDDYCKEVSYVYSNEVVKKKEAETLKNFTKPSEVVKMPY